MGQSMKKLATGQDHRKMEAEIGKIVEKNYDRITRGMDKGTMAELYRAVCQAIEEINKELGGTQFRAPRVETLKQAFEKHHRGRGAITKDEFRTIFKDLIFDTGFLGSGAKDIVIHIFGVPITTLLIKNLVMPTAIPNDIFIPAVTSATVYVLAKLNKI